MPGYNPEMLRVSTRDDKYTLIQDADGKTSALRYDEPWMDSLATVPGSHMTLAFAYEVEYLRAQVEAMTDAMAAAQRLVDRQCLGNEGAIVADAFVRLYELEAAR
jgi:hypothetical protein